MIAVIGRHDDPPVSLLLEALQDAGVAYCHLELGALDRDGLHIEVGAGGLAGSLLCAGVAVPLHDIRSAYARPLAPGRWADPIAARRAQAAFDDVIGWLDGAAALVVNPPRAMNSNNSKTLQAQAIGGAGFAVPDTLVTSSADEALAFWREHRRVIYKSISGVRSIVTELDAAGARRLALLRDLPVQFQAWVPGIDLRVHVVGTECYAAEIESSATDYRYARGATPTRLQAHTLACGVADRCVALAQALGLALAGIDLRRRPDGEHVCFEVNPMPAYSYYESHTGQPISVALARLLAAA